MAGFQQRHGTHPHPTDASSTGVTCEVVGRRSGTRQDETTAQTGMRITGSANMGPNVGRKLPLVEEPWRSAFEHGLWCDASCEPGARVLLEQHLTASKVLRRPCLAATPGPFHDHGGRCSESIPEIVMDYPGEITGGGQSTIGNVGDIAVGHGTSTRTRVVFKEAQIPQTSLRAQVQPTTSEDSRRLLPENSTYYF